jgi:hypothetical protein
MSKNIAHPHTANPRSINDSGHDHTNHEMGGTYKRRDTRNIDTASDIQSFLLEKMYDWNTEFAPTRLLMMFAYWQNKSVT